MSWKLLVPLLSVAAFIIGSQQIVVGQNTDSEIGFEIPESEKPFWDSAQEFIDAYANRESALIGDLFTEDAEFLDEFGNRTVGRTEIASHFQATFEAHPEAQIHSIDILNVRSITDSVVLEEGFVTASETVNGPQTTTKYVAIHEKAEDGVWRIDVLKDFPRQEMDRREQLAQLSWMLGKWINEDSESIVRSDCDWSDDGNFLLRRFSVQLENGLQLKGVQRTAWDPAHHKLRSWMFDSEGGFSTGYWTNTDDGWILTSSGFTADGSTVTATAVYEVVDAEMLIWRYQHLSVGNDIRSEMEPITMVRQPPDPKVTSAPPIEP